MRIEQEGSAVGHLKWDEDAGTLFFDDVILPPAEQRTVAVVRVAAGHVLRNLAATGECHTHRAVHKSFDLKFRRNLRTDLPDSVEAQFVGKNDAGGAELSQRVSGLIVRHAGLRRNVNLRVRGDLAGRHEDADIKDDECIDADLAELSHVLVHLLDFVRFVQDIAGNEDASIAIVSEGDGVFEILEREVLRRATHAKLLAAAIHGVGAEIYRRLQCCKIARWSQNLRSRSPLHGLKHTSSRPYERTRAGAI